MDRAEKLHRWMMTYQGRNLRLPSMDEMAEAIEAKHRSSAQYELKRLAERGQVKQVGEPGQARCWRALDKEPHQQKPKQSESAHFPDREADELVEKVVPMIRVEEDDK